MTESDIAPFRDIPWVSTLLQDDSFLTIRTASREHQSTTQRSLLSKTIKTSSTIPACLSQYKPRVAPESAQPVLYAEVYRMFVTLGAGLNGYLNTLHGGMVATLLDECMGLLLSMRGEDSDGQGITVTAFLNTRFLRPVPTPSTLLVQARLMEETGNRKWRIQGDIRDSEDQVLATAESLYVRIRSKI